MPLADEISKLLSPMYSPLHVPLGRELSVRMDITGVCNLRCKQCTLHRIRSHVKGKDSVMPISLFERIAKEVFPFAHTVSLSCEAEPTLHPEFDAVLEIVKQTPGPVYFVTTHGNGISDQRLQAMVDSGIGGIAVSVDGMSADTYESIRERGKFEKVIRTLRTLAKMKAAKGIPIFGGPLLQINYTLMQSTIDELEDAVRFCAEYGVAHLVVVHMHGAEINQLHEESLQLTPERSDSILTRAQKLARALGVQTFFPPFFEPLVRINGVSKEIVNPASYNQPACLAPWNMLRIRYNGDILPCDLWDMNLPIDSISNKSFMEIWNSAHFIRLRESHIQRQPAFGPCKGCTATSPDNLEKKSAQNPISFTRVET